MKKQILTEDILRLRHVHQAYQDVLDLISQADVDEVGFINNKTLQLAVERLFEIAGEAARSVTDETRYLLSNIPFREIISMRNFLIHEYHRIDPSVVWNTIEQEIPLVIEELERVLEENK